MGKGDLVLCTFVYEIKRADQKQQVFSGLWRCNCNVFCSWIFLLAEYVNSGTENFLFPQNHYSAISFSTILVSFMCVTDCRLFTTP